MPTIATLLAFIVSLTKYFRDHQYVRIISGCWQSKNIKQWKVIIVVTHLVWLDMSTFSLFLFHCIPAFLYLNSLINADEYFVCFLKAAIGKATTLEEVERLSRLLQAGHLPNSEPRQPSQNGSNKTPGEHIIYLTSR